MKRIIASFMVIVTLCTATLSLGGCSSANVGKLTLGQWLGLLNNAFGMETYIHDEPYYSNIGKDNVYYNTVQIAAEWNVISKNDKIDPLNVLCWKDALITLVNVGNFMPSDASEEEKIQYAIAHFDNSIRKYWLNRTINVSDATNLLLIAQEQWSARIYDNPVEEITYCDSVVDFSSIESTMYKIQDDVIMLAPEISAQLSSGDIIVMPADAHSNTTTAYRVTQVSNEEGKTVIEYSTDVELGDFVEELYIEQTMLPNLSQAEIYDGNGNLIQSGEVRAQSYQDNEMPNIDKLIYTGETKKTVQTGLKTTFEFTTPDGYKAQVEIKDNSVKAKIEVPVVKEGPIGYIELGIDDLTVSNRIDYSWFTLHAAEVRVDYTSKLKVGIKKELLKSETKIEQKWELGKDYYSALKQSVLGNKNSGIAEKNIKLAAINLASVGVAGVTLEISAKFKVDGSVELSITENGSKGIEYSNGNCRVINTSNKDKDLSFKCKAELTLGLAAKVNAFGIAIIGLKADGGIGAEGSVTIHLADSENHLISETTAYDLPLDLADTTYITGISADAYEIAALAEQQGGIYTVTTNVERVELRADICGDVSFYYIVRIGIDEETLAGKLLKGTKGKVEWEICGKDNSKFLSAHIEDDMFQIAFDGKSLCTKKYKPFDTSDTNDIGDVNDAEENIVETSAPQNNDKDISAIGSEDVNIGEVLIASAMKLTLIKNETRVISIVQLPKGYTLDDITYQSLDNSIVTIDSKGVVHGVSSGTTTIIITTRDEKYSYACAITVQEESFQ